MGRFILKRKLYSKDKHSVWNSQAWDESNGGERATKMIIDGKKGLYGVDPDVTRTWNTDKFIEEVHGYNNRSELKGKIGKNIGDRGELHVGLKYSKWNPWNTDVSINNYFDAAKNGKSGRDSFIHGETRGKSAKEIYKDYLEMLKYKGVVDDSSGYMSNKEMKDALRQLEKRRKILKGAYIGGGTAAVAGLGYGANKLYNKRKE